jgi:hypothetical protein
MVQFGAILCVYVLASPCSPLAAEEGQKEQGSCVSLQKMWGAKERAYLHLHTTRQR